MREIQGFTQFVGLAAATSTVLLKAGSEFVGLAQYSRHQEFNPEAEVTSLQAPVVQYVAVVILLLGRRHFGVGAHLVGFRQRKTMHLQRCQSRNSKAPVSFLFGLYFR